MSTTNAQFRALHQLDRDIVKMLKDRPQGTMSYVIANILGEGLGYQGIKTAKVMRRLKWMERIGDVERVPTDLPSSIHWRAKAKDA